MSKVIRLDQENIREVTSQLAIVLRKELRSLFKEAQSDGHMSQGIQLLTAKQVAERLGKSVRHLYRLEKSGELPRRRQISHRKTAYFQHELDDFPAEAVMVRDQRTISRAKLAQKLRLDKRTIAALVDDGELPEPIDGCWYERDIDRWLVRRPKV